jgi:hypothetical protein
MTKPFRFLPLFAVRREPKQHHSRMVLGAVAAGALWFACGLGASAQSLDALRVPPFSGAAPRVQHLPPPSGLQLANYHSVQEGPIGSAVPELGVIVGPGGPTDIRNVPSAMMGPGTVPGGAPGAVQGPFVRSVPLYNEGGYEVPCPCDAGCDFTWFASAEALYFNREGDENFTLSQFNRMSDFDYELGGRFTIGRLWDCVNGWDVTYIGPYEWNRGSDVADPGALQSRLIPAGGLVAGDLDTFNNADRHIQTHRARLNSLEWNRRHWAWDVMSVFIGVRAIDYREDYAFNSQSGLGNGLYQVNTRNFGIGPQIGGDLRRAVGLRGQFGVKGKAGILANFNRGESFLQNDGTVLGSGSDRDLDVAGIFELGVFGVYSVTRSIRLTGGYEGWFMPGIATVSEQNPAVVSPDIGNKVFATDELFFHGGSAGVEILF